MESIPVVNNNNNEKNMMYYARDNNGLWYYLTDDRKTWVGCSPPVIAKEKTQIDNVLDQFIDELNLDKE